jgi:hypothetical protein
MNDADKLVLAALRECSDKLRWINSKEEWAIVIVDDAKKHDGRIKFMQPATFYSILESLERQNYYKVENGESWVRMPTAGDVQASKEDVPLF